MTNLSTSNNDIDNTIIDTAMPDAPPHNPQPTEVDNPKDAHPNEANKGDTIHKVYLSEYQAPSYSVENVSLDIRLYENDATVASILEMKRQNVGDLVLFGQDMSLESITMNGKALDKTDYQLDDQQLVIKNAPDKVTLALLVRHQPQKNTALEGLYIAGEGNDAMYVTQCEPEGFRKITYYPDRPDVLATFTTRLEADKKFTTLLANGDLIEAGECSDNPNRHFAIWQDPTKKPSYLFACVFADLDVLQDSYTTIEGRKVKLEIYAKSFDIDKCHVAMQALKDAMHWDEQNYGRAYDLDRYMVVAVSQFNMGAMENKGLNIFNTACVLSSPETTTDRRSFNVKAVVAHEYFHNWTGNRITCRDWFQLCLKEGFTVYRDQSFSADHQSPAVQRIDDVSMLRAHQFTEDAGPLAHPPRPDNFVEINNFYTTTVYEKGAEIVRMIANTLGDEFRRGTDTYFERYDGQAVTVEDFLSALSAGNTSVTHFIDWYTQPGTPEVTGYQDYNDELHTLSVTLSQSVRHVDGFDTPKPLPIPVAAAVFDRSSGEMLQEQLLMLDQPSQTFEFTNLATTDNQEPVVSLLRNFSAPVQLTYDYSDEALAFLIAHETSGFNQWQNAQALVNKVLLKDHAADIYLQAMKQAFTNLVDTDAMLAARLLDIPAERELASAISKDYQPAHIQNKRNDLKKQLATTLAPELKTLYNKMPIVDYMDTPAARGERALRNVVLDLALTAGMSEAFEWAQHQYDNAQCMTERLGALHAMVSHQYAHKDKLLADFYERFANEALVIDLWFSLQAGDEHASVEKIADLLEHADFDWGTPNRIRAVVGSFAAQATKLWTQQGLALYTKVVARLDATNPVLASRLLQALSRWYTLAEPMRQTAKAQLEQLTLQVHSKNVKESLQSMLQAD